MMHAETRMLSHLFDYVNRRSEDRTVHRCLLHGYGQTTEKQACGDFKQLILS